MRRALLAGPPAAATLLLLSATGTPASTAPAPGTDTHALFLEHCATCHGETGDGKGVTQLDRPARSFKDGGFSYGNTPKALLRTITSGIPGTPMPGFEMALTEEQRDALAEYVISLGPPQPEVDPRSALLEVTDRPLVVRGHFPAIAESATEHPRGLLIGMPSGVTFQWRTDDVRLLGLRMGSFVDRADWGGRGGTPLKPLGKVVHLIEKGDPEATWAIETGRKASPDRDALQIQTEPLRADLAGTWVRGQEAGVRYRLLDEQGEVQATVEDDMKVLTTSVGSGYERRLRLRSGPSESRIYATLGNRGQERLEAFKTESTAGAIAWEVRQLEPSLYECCGMLVEAEGAGGSGPLVRFELGEDATREARAFVVLIPDWNPEVRKAIETEVKP